MVGFHCMNVGSRKSRVAPPNSVTIARLAQSIPSTFFRLRRSHDTWKTVARIASPVAMRIGSWVIGMLGAIVQLLSLPPASLYAAKNTMTGNRSKRIFMIVYYTSLSSPPRTSAPPGETSHGRTPHRAEIPVRGRARARRLLVVPLRGLEEPAVLRRHSQDHRVHSGEIHDHQGREALAVRLQAHAETAVLRRHS